MLLVYKKSCLLVFAMILAFFLRSCTTEDKQKTFVIGFSQCIEDNWRKAMEEDMKRELSFHSNLKFISRQADGNSHKQIQQVRELLKESIDLLIISPNEVEPLTPVVEEIYNKGIPVIVLDRKIASKLYTAFVGSDNFDIGKQAGDYAAKLLNGKGNIVEITGLPKSSPAIERHNGFLYAMQNHPAIKIIKTIDGEWIKHTAQTNLSAALTPADPVDLIYTHNDLMGLGAYEVLKKKGFSTIPKIIGVDGLPDEGMQFVSEKVLTATMLYLTGGEESIQIANQILNKEEFKKDTYLQTSVVDSTNVRLFQLQANKVKGQQKEIERQQSNLLELVRAQNTQRTFLYMLVLIVVLAISFGGIAFYSLRENRMINKKLNLQNIEILNQKDQLVEISAKAQLANEAKVNFFINISHEFRTPLTLILGPLEDMLLNIKNASPSTVALVHKNAMRLLRMVNQLIDFRKIEVDKMAVKASENNLIQFVSEIVELYKPIARKRNIDLRLIAREPYLKVWFDTALFDKVIFNLISNAIKFTSDNGYVNVHIAKNELENMAIIKIEDTGIGISKEEQEHLFEMFYQGRQSNYKWSSGIGLSLSKEFVRLHKGTISVNSEPFSGSIFTIRIPLGTSHLERDEIVEGQASATLLHGHELSCLNEDGSLSPVKADDPIPVTAKEHSILLIEDNDDLRNFLSDRLGKHYEIIEAKDGESATQVAFDNIPDLIICDVVIPVKDGISLTSIFKADVRTSHIPVILLTARISVEQQIQGMRSMADAYITKPFNVNFLDETIKSLITNRDRLKEHFSGNLPANPKTTTVSKVDKKFLNEFASFIEANISNENLNVEHICKNLGVSKIQLYRKIKAMLGVNINDYILNIRLKKAMYLLQNEGLSISEVSYKVGFSSPGYFSTVFKSKFNITPKEFKNNNR